jgi:hypothetical protein
MTNAWLFGEMTLTGFTALLVTHDVERVPRHDLAIPRQHRTRRSISCDRSFILVEYQSPSRGELVSQLPPSPPPTTQSRTFDAFSALVGTSRFLIARNGKTSPEDDIAEIQAELERLRGSEARVASTTLADCWIWVFY